MIAPVVGFTDVPPLAGGVTTATEEGTSVPSESVSFARTLTTTGVFTGVVAESLLATGGLLPPTVIEKFASETSKKMLPTASIFTRAWLVVTFGSADGLRAVVRGVGERASSGT